MMMIVHEIHVYELQCEMCMILILVVVVFGATQVVAKRSEQGLKP